MFGSQLALVLLSSKGHCRQVILVGEYVVGYLKKTLLWFYYACVCVRVCAYWDLCVCL